MNPARRCSRWFLVTSLVAFITGCVVVGPKYEEPTPDLQSTWSEVETPALSSDPPLDPEWWKSAFNDPVLNSRIESAIAENLSLRSAALRVLQARQQLAIAVGNQYPQQQTLSASADSKKLSDNATDNVPLLDDRFALYNLGFSLTWEVDFFGRFKLAVRTASALFDASVSDYDGVMVTLLASVAQNYLLIRTFEERIKVAERNLELQEESLRITTAKFDAGAVSSLDVNQAQTLLYNTRAQVSGMYQSLQQTRNSLAILLGQPPQNLGEYLKEEGPIPSVPAEIAVGMPQELIRRRPDIRAAERQLAAQSAQVGYAVSDLYPHFSIGGSIGTGTTSLGGKNILDMFNSDSVSSSLFGVFQWNLLQYGRLRSNVRLQDALFQQLLADYRNTVLQAQGEIENAIVAYLRTQEQLVEYTFAAAAAQRAVDVSSAQYEDGLVDFNTVITTLNALRQQQDLLASAQGTVATNLVQVYKSLGGGWEVRGDSMPDEILPQETKDEMLDRSKYWKKILQ